jgi:hypothetical protein
VHPSSASSSTADAIGYTDERIHNKYEGIQDEKVVAYYNELSPNTHGQSDKKYGKYHLG